MMGELAGKVVDVPEHVGGPHAAYLALLAAGTLAFQACNACTAAVFPPRGRCSRCGADALEWRASDGHGSVYSTTVLTPRDKPAYAVVLVDLDEGYRMMSRMDDESVAIGDRVSVHLDSSGDEVLPLFALIEGVR